MTADEARALYREHCPVQNAALCRYGEEPAVAAILAAVKATREKAAKTAEAYAAVWRDEDNTCHVEVDYVANAIRSTPLQELKGS